MGVLQRFERRLEGLVEGAFARAFGGVVQPVEVAAALQREAADKKVLVAQGRVLVPNQYVVELGKADCERLGEYDQALREELAAMVSEHAQEQGWSFVGPVAVKFEGVDDLKTGIFRVRSAVAAGSRPVSAPEVPGNAPRLEIASGTETGRVLAVRKAVTVLGRGTEADIRLTDTGVSRSHAELHLDAGRVTLVDRQSTNGTTVNGRRIDSALLHDGDRIGLGASVLVFRQDG